jgi:hypothetical protein
VEDDLGLYTPVNQGLLPDGRIYAEVPSTNNANDAQDTKSVEGQNASLLIEIRLICEVAGIIRNSIGKMKKNVQ